MPETLFDKIVGDEIPTWKVWEDDTHLAFLTPFTAHPGTVVVIPKQNIGDDVFELPEADYQALWGAARTVAAKLKRAFKVDRVAVVVEGMEVPHVHIRLYPVNEHYLAYPSQGKVEDTEMDQLQERIKAA